MPGCIGAKMSGVEDRTYCLLALVPLRPRWNPTILAGMVPIPGFVTRLRWAAAIIRGRHLWRPGRSSRSGVPEPDGLLCVVDRFSVFQDSVRLVGWAFLPRKALRAAELQMPGGKRYPLSRFRLFSPELAKIYGPGASHSRFDETLSVSESPDEVAHAILVLRFDDREPRYVTDLGSDHRDEGAHALYRRFLAMLEEKGDGRLLEIGSRARSGTIQTSHFPANWTYTGVDLIKGPNVDIVGDAHRLSQLLSDVRFDAVVSISVLEHILMPWRFAIELNRVLNQGAIGFISSHQSWPLHDQPWDFWRFSDTAWAALFNQATGFEVLGTGLGERAYIVAEKIHPITAHRQDHPVWGMSAVLFRKIGDTQLDWPVEPEAIIHTNYPA